MGYTTTFNGALMLSRPLTFAEAKQLLEFNENPDTIEGEHPGSYMQWVPTTTLNGIVWDGNEKFYHYTEWMQWLVRWLQERGIEISGELLWSGEDSGDIGTLSVSGGVVVAGPLEKKGRVSGQPLTLDKLGEMALSSITSQA